METEEIYKLKLELQSNITIAVAKLYREFAAETGVFPESIHINLADCTAVGDTKRQLCVLNTDIDIRI